jgi:hypothetical protein
VTVDPGTVTVRDAEDEDIEEIEAVVTARGSRSQRA